MPSKAPPVLRSRASSWPKPLQISPNPENVDRSMSTECSAATAPPTSVSFFALLLLFSPSSTAHCRMCNAHTHTHTPSARPDCDTFLAGACLTPHAATSGGDAEDLIAKGGGRARPEAKPEDGSMRRLPSIFLCLGCKRRRAQPRDVFCADFLRSPSAPMCREPRLLYPRGVQRQWPRCADGLRISTMLARRTE